MGKLTSYHIDVPHRHPLCSALSYEEHDRLVEKIGLKAAVALGYRIMVRDHMLKYDRKKSVPKHRLNPKDDYLP